MFCTKFSTSKIILLLIKVKLLYILMNIKFLVIGKTENSYLKEGILDYQQRLCRYVNFEIEEINIKGNMIKREVLLQKEAEKILAALKPADKVILLDEKGEQYTSVGFSKKIETFQYQSISRLVIICGGAYGFDEQIYQRSNQLLSLSKMTYTHQMVRLIFLEQLYRAFTIIKNEKYHHI